jgi:hypothetical protein
LLGQIDWKTYYGSNPTIKQMLKEGKQDISTILENDPFLDEKSYNERFFTETFIRLDDSNLSISQDPNHTGGRKFDGGKLQYGLLPPLALRETVKVLTFGAEKYEPDNWKRVPDSHRRYFDAAQRHLWAYKEGEVNDPESGVNHLAHALCCIMFMLDLDEEKNNVAI